MKVLIALMVLTLLVSVAMVGPDLGAVLRGLVPTLPSGSAASVLSLMGGVGGSVTLLAYGYWIREKGWSGTGAVGRVRLDLTVGYALTGLFGMAMLLLAAVVLGGGEGMPSGSQGLVACGDAIREATTRTFWCIDRIGRRRGVSGRRLGCGVYQHARGVERGPLSLCRFRTRPAGSIRCSCGHKGLGLSWLSPRTSPCRPWPCSSSIGRSG